MLAGGPVRVRILSLEFGRVSPEVKGVEKKNYPRKIQKKTKKILPDPTKPFIPMMRKRINPSLVLHI